MSKYQEMNRYSIEEYTDLIRNMIIIEYGSTEKLTSKFQQVLEENVETFFSPKLLTKIELQNQINTYSAKMVDVILNNATEDNLYKMLSNDFTAKCSTGVIMANERPYLEEVANMYVKSVIAKALSLDLQAKKKALKGK